MSSGVLRLLTMLLAVMTIVAAFLVPGAKEYLLGIGIGLAGWGTPHPADKVVGLNQGQVDKIVADDIKKEE